VRGGVVGLREVSAEKSALVAQNLARIQYLRVDIEDALETIDVAALRAGSSIPVQVLLPRFLGLE
jgi:hypothetical protein